ncbi:hypothetical protein PMAN_a3338 [Pseudoalteromonas marina]|uniref:DUF2931 family protein n=1 Tax=Pseudoalteromonas marina TaxID=267375 RepID=UPI00026CEFB3|nr:DUF2931 family protein [Pseudoalteromonas marina]KAF7774762.1 hypothetical protein PMAN_a3338 [Pseudoalteromonas marina]
MDKLIKLLITLTLTLFAVGCSSTGKIDYMVAGVGTENGNAIWGRSIVFDDEWGIPSGAIECCYAQAGGTVSVYDQKFPEKVAVEWLDKSENRFYFGEVAIDKNGYRLAKDLPRYTVVSTGRKAKEIIPYLIIGMSETGEIKVWLSNAPSGRNRVERVLHELASGQAQWRENNS